MTQDANKIFISVVTPCYNEIENVNVLCDRIRAVFDQLPDYRFEHIFIDNCSTDGTVNAIKSLASRDTRIKLIANTRNFGHIRSPMYGMLQARGDAVVLMASDLQDPPELIATFIELWTSGYKVVAAVKPESHDSAFMTWVRTSYYHFLGKISDIGLVKNFTGFGLYDRVVMDAIAAIDDRYPYFRGMISELGYPVAEVPFVKPARLRGITKNNFFTLYDMAMLGITTNSRLPIRIATMFGFALSGISLLISIMYLILKIIFWDRFTNGTAPVLIGLFFFSSVQLFFIGLLGEYVAAIHTQVMKRPLVIEQERVNFED